MKNLMMITALVLCSNAFGADGKVRTRTNSARPQALDVFIEGEAAEAISIKINDAKIPYRRDPFSGQLVQRGGGIRCVKQTEVSQPYCYFQMENGSVLKSSDN